MITGSYSCSIHPDYIVCRDCFNKKGHTTCECGELLIHSKKPKYSNNGYRDGWIS